MATPKNWLRLVVPTGWDDVLVRTLKVAVAAFLVLVAKEWLETKEWDLRACAIDGATVAAGSFVMNAILRVLAPR